MAGRRKESKKEDGLFGWVRARKDVVEGKEGWEQGRK